jgi:hypothetical protein
VVVKVVGSWDQEIGQVRGYSTAKPKIGRGAGSIGLASKQLAESVVATCRVGEKWPLRWWEAGTGRLSRCRGIPPPNRKLCAGHAVSIWHQNSCRGV